MQTRVDQNLIIDNFRTYLLNRGRNELENEMPPGYCWALSVLFSLYACQHRLNDFFSLINNVIQWNREEDIMMLNRIEKIKQTEKWMSANKKLEAALKNNGKLNNLSFSNLVNKLVEEKKLHPSEAFILSSTKLPDDASIEKLLNVLQFLQLHYRYLMFQTIGDLINFVSDDRILMKLFPQETAFETDVIIPKNKLIDILKKCPVNTSILLATGRHAMSLYRGEDNDFYYYDSSIKVHSPRKFDAAGLASFMMEETYSQNIGENIPLSIIIHDFNYQQKSDTYLKLEKFCDQFLEDQLASTKVITKEKSDYPVDGITPLILATQANHQKQAQKIINRGIDTGELDGLGFSPMHYAAFNLDMMKLLVENGFDVNQRTSMRKAQENILDHFSASLAYSIDNITPLYIACAINNKKVVLYLLEKGANVNACGVTGVTPLTIAAINGHQEMVELLLMSGAKPNIHIQKPNAILTAQNKNDKQPLAHFGAIDLIKFADCRNVITAAALNDKKEMVDFLLKTKLEAEDSLNNSLALEATEKGMLGLLQQLVKHHFSCKDLYEGQTLLDIAIRNHHYHLVDFFLEQGISPRKTDTYSTLELVTKGKDIKAVSKIFSWYVNHQKEIPSDVSGKFTIRLLCDCYHQINIDNINALLLDIFRSYIPAGKMLNIHLYGEDTGVALSEMIVSYLSEGDPSPIMVKEFIDNRLAKQQMSTHASDFFIAMKKFIDDYFIYHQLENINETDFPFTANKKS